MHSNSCHFSDMKNGFFAICIFIALALLAGGNAIGRAEAQVQTNPLPSEQVTTELLMSEATPSDAVAIPKTTSPPW